MEDHNIIQLYFDRDEKAIEASGQKYGNYCFYIANNILQNVQDSQECVNDTWLNAWNSIPPTRPNCLKLFFAKITRNLSINRYNNKKSKQAGCYTEALNELNGIISGNDATQDEAECNRLRQSINTFLASVSPRDCNVFIKRYFFFEPISVISDHYGISANNVHKILSRVRMQLKQYLQKEGYTL